MNTKQTVGYVSVSALAAGMAQGAVVYSGSLDAQQTYTESVYRQGVDMTGDSFNDFTFGYDGSAQKPYIDTRTAIGLDAQSGAVDILGQGDSGLPVTPAGTMIDAAYESLNPVIAGDRGYLYQNDSEAVVGDWPANAVTEGFVGVKLTLSGQTHYGWLRLLNNPTSNPQSLTLRDWAYESTPNLGIETTVVPEPSAAALAGLAAALALAARRKQD
jgi:hypothetical protein